jgi:hypothetical protein
MPHARPDPQTINLPRRVIFLHIAKTAGTSVVHFFRSRLPPGMTCSHGDFLSFPQQSDAFAQKLEEYRFLSGHFGYSDVATLLPGAYSFTFLRDPVDRVLSLYKFCMHSDMQKQFPVARAARDLGLEGWLSSTLPEVSEMLDNQQTWQLARNYWQEDRNALGDLSQRELLQLATSHLTEFDRVGLTETFDDDFQHILSDLDIQASIPGARQFRTVDPVSSEQLPAHCLETLRNRLALDYELINHVQSQRRQTQGTEHNGAQTSAE